MKLKMNSRRCLLTDKTTISKFNGNPADWHRYEERQSEEHVDKRHSDSYKSIRQYKRSPLKMAKHQSENVAPASYRLDLDAEFKPQKKESLKRTHKENLENQKLKQRIKVVNYWLFIGVGGQTRRKRRTHKRLQEQGRHFGETDG